jgi:MYXO-CTERM domain-containing protein
LGDSSKSVFAARVDATGKVIAPTATLVATGDYGRTQPHAVWTGQGWLVVWGQSGGATYGVGVAQLDANGALTSAPTSFYVVPITGNATSSPDVAWDGTNALIAFTDGSVDSNSHISALRVAPDGTLVDKTAFAISRAAGQQVTPRVVYDGIEYFVTWADSRAGSWDIYGARVSVGGVLVDGPATTGGVPLSTATGDQTAPVVASNGSAVLVAWLDGRAGTSALAYYGARFVSASGLVDGPAATGGFKLGAATVAADAPALTFDGQNYVAAWSTWDGVSTMATGDAVGVRVSSAGALVGAPVTFSSAPQAQSAPAVGGGKSGSFVAWVDARQGAATSTIDGTRADTSGSLLDGPAATGGIEISKVLSLKNNAVVVPDGDGYFAAWIDNRQGVGTSSVYAARFDDGGTQLDAPATAIALNRQQMGNLAIQSAGGTGYVVTWTEYASTDAGVFSTLVARFLDAKGKVVNGPATSLGRALSTYVYEPCAIAWNGTDFLLVWGSSSHLTGARFSATGTVRPASGSADGTFPVATTANASDDGPALDFDGTNYQLVWTSTSSSVTAVYASRLDPAGARLDGTLTTPGVLIVWNSTTYRSLGPLSIAFDGTEHLISCGGPDNGANHVTKLLKPGGTPTDAQFVLYDPQFGPGLTSSGVKVGYDGRSFWATWSGNTSFQGGAVNGVFGARIRSDGAVRDPGYVEITSNSEALTGMAGGHLGELMFVYGRGADAHGMIVIDDAPNGSTCSGTDGSLCASGVCEDGVCCDVPCGGATNDCQACSVSAGGAKDGVCGPAKSGHTCRAATTCDLAGTCDGVSAACPPDYFLPPTTSCAPATECMLATSCTGTSATCPVPTPATNGTLCGDGGTCTSGACVVDAGVDAGPDSGPEAGTDAGHDGGGPPDASDAGDAGSDASSGGDDASSPADASGETSADASAAPDASRSANADASAGGGEDGGERPTTSGGPSQDSGGCGCQTAGSTSSPQAMFGFAALALVAVRRRRQRR